MLQKRIRKYVPDKELMYRTTIVEDYECGIRVHDIAVLRNMTVEEVDEALQKGEKYASK